MHIGVDAGRQSSSTKKTETTASLRGGGGTFVEINGVLFQGGALLCGEGGDDMFCEAENIGAR